LLALLALCACHRERHYVVKVEVSSALWPAQVKAGGAPELRSLFLSQLKRLPGVRQVPPEKVPDRAPRYTLNFTPALIGAPARGGGVVATVALRREQGGLAAVYSVEAGARFGRDADPPAVKKALEEATAHVVTSVGLQMAALEAKPSQLHEDLRSPDAQVRSFALARLAETRDPAAIPGLRAALKSDDADQVRRAIGGLVALQDVGAVPALIDAAHGRPPEFKREVIYALGEIGGADAQGYLYTLSQGADLEPIRAAALEALHELEARLPPQETHR
jgi:hypothetical protein